MKPSHPQAVLRYLADLAPKGKQVTDVVARKSEFAWMGAVASLIEGPPRGETILRPKTDKLRRLAAIDSLHPTESLLRLGWLFLAGTIERDGKKTRYCVPLLSVPIRLANRGFNFQLLHTGNIEMPGDLFDWEARLELEESPDAYGGGSGPDTAELLQRLPKLNLWVAAALKSAGLPKAVLRGGLDNPLDYRDEDGLNVLAGSAIYTARDVATPNISGVLRSWSLQHLSQTAFGALYEGEAVEADPEQAEVHTITTPLPLNRSQRQALDRLRTEWITVVSGPPGTGKSHLVAAAAIDQVAQGRSVLIATQSEHAANVIADLLERHPGPRFVQFGSRADRESVAAELGDGLAQPLSNDDHKARNEKAVSAGERAHQVRSSIELLLNREIDFAAGLARRARQIHSSIELLLNRENDLAEGLEQRESNLLVAAGVHGGLEEGFDLEMAEHLMERARVGLPLLRGISKRRAGQRLRSLVGCDSSATLDDIEAGLGAARAERAIQRGLAGGGLSLVDAWQQLESADSDYRNASGLAIEAQRRSRTNSRRRSTRAVALLASALRAGRARRRKLLRNLSTSDFLDVLPLWIGTLQDIDDTLPVIRAAFDVVIFDEASQIDQMRAAPALARARRAMIVGDPRQLRHVSFVSDEAMDEAAATHELGNERARLLDVRRNSLFDTGAAATRITWLDEHFRSVPHIIKFSDRHFYNGNLRLMTQHPRNETRDAIHTVKVEGSRDDNGVNQAEVDEVLRQIERYAAGGASSIGVVSPFRGQADALEAAILAAYGPEDVERLGLRSGTVHAFQGSEREVVIASLAIDGDGAARSLRFLQNPNLFNVLVTRAKREMIVVTSVVESELPRGLLADYLRHAEHAPRPVDVVDAGDAWTGDIAGELAEFGVTVSPGYPVAGWSVDLAIGENVQAIAVETRVHPDGAEAHIQQHMALRRAGWDMADAFQSRWLTDPSGAAEMLSKQMLKRQKS